MAPSLAWGRCLNLGGGGRVLRPVCVAKYSANLKPGLSPLVNDQEHLQRSLDLGPARKQAPDFEYVAVAFRSQPRSRRHKALQQRGGAININRHKGGINKIFGRTDGSREYHTLEVVSGDRRLLFEQSSIAIDSTISAPIQSATGPGFDGTASHLSTAATTTTSDLAQPHPRPRQQLQIPRHARQPYLRQHSMLRTPDTMPQRQRDDPAATPQPCQLGVTKDAAMGGPCDVAIGDLTPCISSSSSSRSTRSSRRSSSRLGNPAAVITGPTLISPGDMQQQPQQPQQQQQLGKGNSRSSGRQQPVARRSAAERLATAAALLQLPVRELRRYRGFCSELRALELSPSAFLTLCGALVQVLGLAPPQLCAVLLRQPHVLRVPAGVLMHRGAALALELQLPPPPGPGGGGPLAAIVAAAPDILLRRSSFAGTVAALATALELQLAEALHLLRREPQLLRHPPGFYALGVAQLREQLGLQPSAAAALAVAEPQLLAVSPGVLHTNGAMLRSRLQLHHEQLAEMVTRAPQLLVQSPGVLRAVVQRLTAVLSRSTAWREALPRLLASPRNLAVALSFGSDRYDRLEYLVSTGRDRIMGFKEALSLEDEDFREMFPEYVYNAWRQAVRPHTTQPQSQLQLQHMRTQPVGKPIPRSHPGVHDAGRLAITER